VPGVRRRYGIVSDNEPTEPPKVACTTTVPDARAVTIPVEETVARSVFNDCHVAVDVTSWEVPSDILATASSCEVVPTAGTDPLTLTADTEVEGLTESPQAAARTASPTPTTNANLDRRVAPIP
jgi:hypothetical protein